VLFPTPDVRDGASLYRNNNYKKTFMRIFFLQPGDFVMASANGAGNSITE